MEQIKNAMLEANVDESQLTKELQMDIADYKKLILGINLLKKNGKSTAKADEKAIYRKRRIIEDIFELGEELNSGGGQQQQEESQEQQQEQPQSQQKQEQQQQQEPIVEPKKKTTLLM